MKMRERLFKNGNKLFSAIMISLFLAINCLLPVNADGNDFSLELRQTIKDSNNKSYSAEIAYSLEAENSTSPLPDGSTGGVYNFTVKNDALKSITFNIGKSGNYSYILKPIKNNEKINYDDQSYHIAISVENVGGVQDVVAEIRYIDGEYDGDKAPGLIYDHRMKNVTGSTPEDVDDGNVVTADPPVRKKISGDKPDKDAEFTFIMEADDPSYPMPDGSRNGIKKMKIRGSGSGEFGLSKYTEPGEYIYRIYEENTKEEGYEYDRSVYTVINSVTENDGKLELQQSIMRPNGTVKPADEIMSFTFINKYTDTADKDRGSDKDKKNKDNDKDKDTGRDKDKSSLVKTGDSSGITKYIIVLLVAFLSFLVAGNVIRNKRI